MRFQPSTRIREVLEKSPRAVAVLERAGVDYSRADQTLHEACAESAMPLSSVLDAIEDEERLDQPPQAPKNDWTEAPLIELIEHIVEQHHRFAKEALVQLSGFKEAFAEHGAHSFAVKQIGSIFADFKEALTNHMLEEEQLLFPYVERLEAAAESDAPIQPPFFGSIGKPAKDAVLQHGESFDAIRQICRIRASGGVAEECESALRSFFGTLSLLEEDMRRHVYLENSVLLPRAVKLEASLKERFTPLGELW